MTLPKDGLDLLPCPFCNGEAVRGRFDIPAIECRDCGASLHRYHKEDAYVAWNHRTNQPAGQLPTGSYGTAKESLQGTYRQPTAPEPISWSEEKCGRCEKTVMFRLNVSAAPSLRGSGDD